MPANVAFRCDGSPAIGAGHMMRCLALAETMAGFGFAPHFYSAPGSSNVLRAMSDSGFESRDAEGSGAQRIADEMGHVAIAVVDGYGLSAADERELNTVATTVVAFEDRPSRAHATDFLLDPTPGRSATDYDGLVSPSARVLAGSDYAILRPLWRDARSSGRDAAAQRILVSMGATDPVNATAGVIRAIEAVGITLPVDIVLGAVAPHLVEIAALLGEHMTLHIDPEDMTALLRGADIAIGAPGSSSFERAMLGLPSILIQTANNQSDIARAFDAAGAATVVPLATLDDATAFGKILTDFLADGPKREVMSAAAAKLCDGRGALRLLAAIAGAIPAKDGARITLRLAETSDSDWLLELQRKPETRRFARNSAAPAAEDHARWYGRLMDDPDRTLLIVEQAGAALGFVRLDRRGGHDAATFEVSIAIDPDHHGRGLGAAALRLARRFAPGAVFDATVLPANLASQALFAHAGYEQIGPDLFRSLPN